MRQGMMMKFALFVLIALAALPAFADDGPPIPPEKIPREVLPFVEKGTRLIALERADLNGDGLQDYVIVLEKQKANPSDDDIEENQRPLLILVRQPDGALKEVKRNEKIIFCSTCGGVMGDPFRGVKTGPKTFTVRHDGGSADRWSNEYTFNYSLKDNTWQLVRVMEETHSAVRPGKAKTRIYTPPKDYGKIDIQDFDPENWKGQGLK
jgi:hypothetical protein